MMKTCLMVLLLVLSGQSMSQNLLVNGEFDEGINGWTNPFVTAEWISSDGGPISGNGSMLVTGSQNNNGVYGMNSDAFVAYAGYRYLVAASFKTPAISVSERGLCLVEWFDSSGQMILQDSIDSGYGVADDVWINLDDYLQAPPLAVSGVVRLMLQSGIPGQVDLPFGLWDDAVVMQETIFIGGFD